MALQQTKWKETKNFRKGIALFLMKEIRKTSKKFDKLFILVTIISLLNFTILFAISQKAIEYYSAGELSYKAGDYATALKNYELALTADPTIEGYDAYIKFKMGLSAYMVGNYDKARSYLSGYNSSFVKELLSSIDKRQAQDEWKRWIMKNKPTSSEIFSTETNNKTNINYTQQSKKSFNILIPALIFSIVFFALVFAELRIMRVKSRVIELPAVNKELEKTEKFGAFTAQQEQKVKESAVQTGQPVEIELMPENARIIDFEKLINSEIDIFKDLFEGVENIQEVNPEELEELNNISAKTTPTGQEETEEFEKVKEGSEESEKERKAILEDLLTESKSIIEGMVSSETQETQTIAKIDSVLKLDELNTNLSETEAKFLERLGEYLENQAKESHMNTEELEVEELEKLQNDFKYFDDLEKIGEEESKILVKKLFLLTRSGEN